jgi:hypothetical protein
MIDVLLLVADVLLGVIVWLLVADFIHKRHRQLQATWFAVRRKLFGK